MPGPPDVLVAMAAPWADFYGDSRLAATVVTSLHVAPLVVGGGAALALDRATLRVRGTEDSARARHLAEQGIVHRLVLGSLALVILSGVALLASDLDVYWGSPVFWIKMGLVALLVANGLVMTRTERSLVARVADPHRSWRRLRAAAAISISLWLTITLLGVALTNYA